MPMLAELVDAVVGVETHRDTHEVELALPTSTAIGTKISNDSSGLCGVAGLDRRACAGAAGGRLDGGSAPTWANAPGPNVV